ncbi:MAG: alpha/beta hydrolase [Hyphomicrobiaceae bacterium]
MIIILGGCAKSPDDPPLYELVDVYFATDRDKRGGSNLSNYFGTKHGKLSYGVASVSIPHDHRMGQLEAPSLLKLEFTQDPSKHVVLIKIADLSRKDVLARIAKTVGSTPKREALVFVHGFANSFEDATRRTAQIKYDLDFPGPAILYSWPSLGQLSGYEADSKSIVLSEENLANVLTDLSSSTGADSIYLIAHSVGTRGLSKALAAITSKSDASQQGSVFRQIILAAPDIDRDVFVNEIMPGMRKLRSNITVYASDKDAALKVSEEINQKPRVGHMHPRPAIVSGARIIDASNVDTLMVGHSYYGENRSIISDMYHLIRGVPADERFGLKKINHDNGAYWEFRR